VYYASDEHFLGCQERKAVVEVESHLMTEYAFGAYSGAVMFHDAVVHYMAQ
jgi:hypothetical protein